MRITSVHVDFAKVFATIVAITLASLGFVSWWVVLLFLLFAIELKVTFKI